MELTILRHNQQQTPERKKFTPIAASTPPPSLKLNKLEPLPEYKRDSTDSIELESLYIAPSLNHNAANNTVSLYAINCFKLFQPQKRKQNLSDSSRRQIDSTTLGLTSLTSFPQMSQTLASKFSSIRKSFRGSKNSIKKVRLFGII